MRIATVCALWMKPLARSVNFSRFMGVSASCYTQRYCCDRATQGVSAIGGPVPDEFLEQAHAVSSRALRHGRGPARRPHRARHVHMRPRQCLVHEAADERSTQARTRSAAFDDVLQVGDIGLEIVVM